MSEMRPLGPTGVEIAPLVLGAMNFGAPTPRDESIAMIDRAIDGGITLIDTADVYVNGESEQILGDALAANGRRDDVLLATKVGMPRGEAEPGTWHRREHIVESCERSLTSLPHRPHRPLSTAPAVVRRAAGGDARRDGRARRRGQGAVRRRVDVSRRGRSWRAWPSRASTDLPSYVSEQPPYNLLDRRIENELVPLCQTYGLAILPWSPLGRRHPRRPLRLGRRDARRLACGPGRADPGPGDRGRASRSRAGSASWRASAGSRRRSSRCCG